MSSRNIILDVRSGERNDSDTGLCLRVVDESSVQVDGRWERVGRDLYEIGSEGVGSYVLISSGDGEIGVESVSVTFKHLRDDLYLTDSRSWLKEVRSEGGDLLTHYFGGTVVRSEVDIDGTTGSGVVGGQFWWSRNDSVRERFIYEDRGWQLLSGGVGVEIGVVGDEGDMIAGLGGELRIGGGNVSDSNVTVYEIGGDNFPVFLEGEEDFTGVEGVVLKPTGKVLFRDGSSHVGESVLYISSILGESETKEVKSGEYLSPNPSLNEYPLLRMSGYGYSEVEFVPTEADLDIAEYGKVKVSRDSGKILCEGSVLYEGLVLSDDPLGFESVDLGTTIGALDEVPVMSVPDGSGLEPSGDATSFRSTGVGLKWEYRWLRMYVSIGGETILPVELVDTLPKKLSFNKAYVVRGTRKVHLSGGWSSKVSSLGHKLFSGHVRLSRKGLPHTSGLKLVDQEGSFRVDGNLVEFTGDVITGSGSSLVSIVGGFLVVGDSSLVDHPNSVSEMNSLKSIGLVPDVEYETGLEFVLTRSKMKGYYSYDDEKVADISGGTTFQILQFEPRTDFSGYGSNKFFKVGDKILEGEIETAFGSSPNGFHWITSRSVSDQLNQETSRINLGSGLRVGGTSLNITQEQLNGVTTVDILEEGVHYDLPSEGLEGQARLISRLGSEILRGQKVVSVSGQTLDLGKDLSLVGVGDFFFDGLNYFKIESISGTSITLSSVLGLQSSRWVIYDGYREGVVALETPDPTKVVGEILDTVSVLERKSVEVYKTYRTLAFDKVLPTSLLYVRKTESGVEQTYPLIVLRDEVLQAPYELSGDHYTSGSYRIKILNVEYEVGVFDEFGQGFTVSDDRVVFQPDSSWVGGDVLFVRKPRTGLTDTAEMDLSLNIQTPFTPSDVFDGATMYFLELLASPRIESTSGTISFEDPLEEGVGVEVSYTPVDAPDSRIIEEMGFLTLQEEATKVNDSEFTYNPKGKVVELLATPTVFLGAEQVETSEYSINQNTIRFVSPVSSTVRVSYTTLSSNGGDATVRTSSGMVIPKYKINKGSTSLSVHRDLTSTLESGDLIHVGQQVFNVSSVGTSSIIVSPPARTDIETENISYLNVPTFTYEGTTVSYAFRSISSAVVTSKPKSPDVFIQGDYRDAIKSNSLIVLQGIPYRVKVVGLDDATGTTKVSVEGFTTGHDFTSTDNFLVSFRPILIEGEKSLSLTTGLIDTEPFELIKYDHSLKRGRSLKINQDYRLNSEAGLIDLVGGNVVSPQVSYYLLHTSLSSVKPFTLLGGRVSKPTYSAEFTQLKTPTEYDGLSLNAKCVISSPDTFQVRIAEEEAYSSEVANELQQSINQDTGSGGKLVVSSPTSQGKSIGLYDLVANDVVARLRINLYNGYIQPIDDLISTATGKVVGDADGSFKFNVLTGGDWISSGLEDPITREIYPRYLSLEYLKPLNPSAYLTSEDPIHIDGVSEDDLAEYLNSLLNEQRPLIENEMDDYVLIGQNAKSSFDLSVGSPYIKTDYMPVYKQMWERHRFSRLYPTNTKMYSYRTPGKLTSQTNGTVIGNVQNNALGQIENITSLPSVTKRPARFRVYDFSLTGFPSAPSSVGHPTFIVSAVPFDEFPIDPATGLPDTTQLISSGTGTIADATIGNVDRTYNGLSPLAKVKISQDGQFYDIINTADQATLIDLGLFPPLSERSEPRYASVKEVIEGCYVVLEGNPFTLKINGKSLIENPPKRGDTLLESFSKDLDDATTPSAFFRVGSDIGLKSSTGELVDISLPSIDEPNWPEKEIAGQNVPASNLALEGQVEFIYTETTPFRYPALDGESLDDTGDESIPFKSRFNERDLLPQIPTALEELQIQTNSEYVYPDEARGTANIEDGVITTSEDFSSLSGVCEQAPRQGDLIILKPDPSGDSGCAYTGVLEIAEVIGDEIHPPLFSNTSNVRYDIDNLIVILEANEDEGVSIRERIVFDAVSQEFNRSEVTFTFNTLPVNTIQQIHNKLSVVDRGNFTLKIYRPFSPFVLSRTFTFIQNPTNWTVSISDGSNTTIGTLLVSTVIGNSITFVQENIPNPLTAAEFAGNAIGSRFSFADVETWLYNLTSQFWLYYSNYVENESTNLPLVDGDYVELEARISSTSTTELFFDFSLSLFDVGTSSPVDKISDNRLGITTNSTYFDSWFISTTDPAIVSAGSTDITPKITINKSFFKVYEEGGSGYQFLESDINNYTTTDFEVVDNTTIKFKSLNGVVRSADPMSIFIGSEVDDSDTILQGVADYGLLDVDVTNDLGKGILRNVVPTHGTVAQVLNGDLLYIENGFNAGTHRVLGRVESDQTLVNTEVFGSSSLLQVTFPKIVSIVNNGDGTAFITTDTDNLEDYFPEPSSGYSESFILLNDNYLNQPQSAQNNVYDLEFAHSMVHFLYREVDGNRFTIYEIASGGDDYPHYSDGTHGSHPTSLTLAELVALIGSGGQKIVGMSRIPFNTASLGYGSIPVNLDHSIEIYFNVAGGYTGTSNQLNSNNIERDSITNEIIAINIPSNVYQTIEDFPQGNNYHDTFITPNDTIKLTINITAGVYLDPTFPLLVRDYAGTSPVEFGDGSSQVRSLTSSTPLNKPLLFDFYEEVNFKVRRLRRFTDVFAKLVYAFEGFRYLYEQRKGIIDSIVVSDNLVELIPKKVNGNAEEDLSGTHTQVGDFINVVSVGDQVQCFNGSEETLYLRILKVNIGSIICSIIRGNTSDVLTRHTFKIITRIPLIPELQAFDQFVEHSFTEIYSTGAIPGISVETENVLTDTNANFISLGVSVGDFLVIDPQGALAGSSPVEYGAPPQGDNGNGITGLPNNLDDNRGAYKVVSIDVNTLTVEFYAGDSGTIRSKYLLLPSVNGNPSQPLRVTSGIVGSSYNTTNDSIHPFSYRILRRNATLDESLAGSMLFFRERTLSWSEVIRSFNQLPTQPYTWTQYESESLIDNVGTGDISHPSNDLLLQDILGNPTPPFIHNETCLSVYDRRMLIEDPKMTTEMSRSPEDGIPTVLENDISSMNARDKRYAWISVRTDQVNGTLAKLSRVDLDNPDQTVLED